MEPISHIKQELEANTRATREILTLLKGQPEFKIPGLLDRFSDIEKMVHKHDRLLLRGGGFIAAFVLVVEALRFAHEMLSKS